MFFRMLFLVSSRTDASILAGLNEERLQQIRKIVRDGFDSGMIHASYAYAGGGSLWIIGAETDGVVSRLLRDLGVKNVEISPVTRTLDLLDAHIEHRRNSAAMLLYSDFDGPKP
jgi:hypothetical protein